MVLEYIRESVRLYEHPRPEHALVLTDRMFPPSHPKYYADEDLTDATDCCRAQGDTGAAEKRGALSLADLICVYVY